MTHRILLTGVLLLMGLGTIPAAFSQEREPPPPLPMMCPSVGAIAGGQVDARGLVEVTLPAGTFHRLLIPPETIYFGYCHVETGAEVALSLIDCLEGSRYAPSPEAREVVDQIVASCRISDAPPEPHCPEGTTVEGGGLLTVEPDLRVTLPSGTFIVSQAPPRTVVFCSVLANGVSMRYQTVLSLNDCSQLGRSTLNIADFDLADAIAASCVIIRSTAGDLPTQSPRGMPAGITPPSTGDGGLEGR
jgi:hypothetical protein